MALAGPARLFGETERISSGSAKVGGRSAIGRELSRAAHLLATLTKDTIDKGLVPGSIVAFRQILKLLMTDSILDWDCERFEKRFLYFKPLIPQALN